MFYLKVKLLLFISFIVLNISSAQKDCSNTRDGPSKQNYAQEGNRVVVKLFYESLCKACIQFHKKEFYPAVEKLNKYVDFLVYPYGNADTIYKNGQITFDCQHGPPECYGNKLHACSIDYLQNSTQAYLLNSCMMGGKGDDRGSNDIAAERCAKLLGIDLKPIKACALGDQGTKLHEYYGKESQKADFSYVPYILINGKWNDGDNFLKDICSAFSVPPPPCAEFFGA